MHTCQIVDCRPRRINVVHLVTGTDAGGLEQVVLTLGRLSDPLRFCHRVVSLRGGGVLVPAFERAGMEVRALPASVRGKVSRIRWIAARLRESGVDIVHTHNPGPHIHGVLAALLCRRPVVVHTKHGRNYPNQKWAVRFNRWASALSDRIVAVSRDAEQVALNVERVPANKILTIANGVDTTRFTASPLLLARAASAVHVGRLDAVKDQVTLLRACRLVVDQIVDFRIDVVGDGPQRPVLEQLCAELRLNDHVRFHGYDADVRPWLRGAQLFVQSSISEGMPLTVLEAMATGRAVVATRVGGLAELVEIGVTGLLVDPGSPRQLADAMLSLLRDPGRLQAMGEAAHARADTQFNASLMTARYESLYRSLLGVQ